MTDLSFPRQVSSEWLINQLGITSEVHRNISLDIQDALLNAGYDREAKLNTNEARTRIERDVLPQIRQTWSNIFSHLSDSSAQKCLWHMSLHVQTQARRSRMSQSPVMVRTPVRNTSINTTPAPSPVGMSIIFDDLMIALFSADGRTATKIRVQDLCSNSDPILENVSYSLLAQIAREDLEFLQDSQKIVFIDTDDIPYVVQNDRNLKAALQSVLQSTQQHRQAGKLHIQNLDYVPENSNILPPRNATPLLPISRGGNDSRPPFSNTPLPLGLNPPHSREKSRRVQETPADQSPSPPKKVRQSTEGESEVTPPVEIFGDINSQYYEYEHDQRSGIDQDIQQDDLITDDMPTIEDQFSRLNNLKACEHLNQEDWIEACRFWKRDPRATDRDIGIPLPPLNIDIYLYQGFLIWWALRKERTQAGGGFISDEMGLGKTIETLGHRITNTLLVEAWDDIDKDRADTSSKPKRHLPLDHTDEDRCPTEPFPFACPCAKSSPSHGFEPISGAALIIAPKGLLSTWVGEFYSRINFSHPLGARLKMYIAHGEARSLTNTLSKSYRTNMDTIPSNNDLEIIRWDRENESPQYGSHFITVLTTSGSYNGHLASRVYRVIQPAEFNLRGKIIRKAKTRCDIVWGIIYRDEFHREKRETAGTPTLIQQINRNQGDWILPALWFLSGTPFEKGPSDLQAYLSLLENSDWPRDPTFSQYTEQKVTELSKEFNKLIKHPGTPKQHRDFIKKFSDLLALFMIRRTCQTDWFGQDLLDLPPHEPRDVRCSVDPKYADYFRNFQAAIRAKVEQDFHDRMQAWRAAGSKSDAPVLSVKTLVGASYKARICATFPFLIKLLEEEVVDLTWDEIVRNTWHINPEESPYFIHLNDIIKSGQKIKVIEKILNMMTTDVHGNPEKLVVLSISPTIAFILWIWFKYMKGYETALFHSNLRLPERSDIKSGFQEEIDIETGKPVVANCPQILVGTLEVLGYGHQLTRAFRIILTEPDHLFSNEYQAIKRINRIGQDNPKTYSYRLYCKESEVEMLIVKRQDARKTLHDAVLAISEHAVSN